MRVACLTLRNFRCYAATEAAFGAGLTVITGPNGAGKTNLLEGIYFGCTGRSWRTSAERELVRFGEAVARVEIEGRHNAGQVHRLSVGLEPGVRKRLVADGVEVERLLDVEARPLISVFSPERLELVKGAPSLRRAHLDQLVAALWPTRAVTRRRYGRALVQRNALLARIAASSRGHSTLESWDRQVAEHGFALMADRDRAVELVRESFAVLAGQLGLDGSPALAYRPRSRATSVEDLRAELAARVESDLGRGFTAHGPHRDDLALTRDGRELRAYGSQGQQRLALLAMLLAERQAIAGLRSASPVMLLDDVMSELDHERRARLVELLRSGGQSVVTATELSHVPGASERGVTRIAVRDGAILAEAAAA